MSSGLTHTAEVSSPAAYHSRTTPSRRCPVSADGTMTTLSESCGPPVADCLLM